MYSKTVTLLGILITAVLASADSSDSDLTAGITFETDEWTHINPVQKDAINAGTGYYNKSFNFLLEKASSVQTYSATLFAPPPDGSAFTATPTADPTARYLVRRP